MRTGLTVSVIGHLAPARLGRLLAAVADAARHEWIEAVPVDLVPVGDITKLDKGMETAELVAKPSPNDPNDKPAEEPKPAAAAAETRAEAGARRRRRRRHRAAAAAGRSAGTAAKPEPHRRRRSRRQPDAAPPEPPPPETPPPPRARADAAEPAEAARRP